MNSKNTFAKAVQYHKNGRLEEAKGLYEEILVENPSHYQSLGNLGAISKEKNQFEHAECYFLEAIRYNPKFLDAYYNLGVLFHELKQFNKALEYYKSALKIKPKSEVIEYNLGNLYKDLGKYRNAIGHYNNALNINPENIDAHFNLGLTLLILSDFENGFAHYEWRKNFPFFNKALPKPDDKKPEWQGSSLKGKTLLVISEQGFGDIVQFARYICLLKSFTPAKVIFKTNKKLKHLFKNNSFKTIGMESNSPKYDYYIYLMSLPKLFFQKDYDLPNQINYIPENSGILKKWGKKIKHLTGPKVGINWSGSANDWRAASLVDFEKLFMIKGINYISLQRGVEAQQINDFKYKEKLFAPMSHMDINKEKNAFEESIGLLRHLDILITNDTALAHVASTIGVETWILLAFSADWRWFLDPHRTVWYDKTKLYRQKKLQDWSYVLKMVHNDLNGRFGND